jgi:hypothetical protein
MAGVATMSEALSQVLGCGVLAAAMGGFEGCDTQCTAGLCNAALASRWEAGMNASADAGDHGLRPRDGRPVRGAAGVQREVAGGDLRGRRFDEY